MKKVFGGKQKFFNKLFPFLFFFYKYPKPHKFSSFVFFIVHSNPLSSPKKNSFEFLQLNSSISDNFWYSQNFFKLILLLKSPFCNRYCYLSPIILSKVLSSYSIGFLVFIYFFELYLRVWVESMLIGRLVRNLVFLVWFCLKRGKNVENSKKIAKLFKSVRMIVGL